VRHYAALVWRINHEQRDKLMVLTLDSTKTSPHTDICSGSRRAFKVLPNGNEVCAILLTGVDFYTSFRKAIME
jgi:hypothetical protein